LRRAVVLHEGSLLVLAGLASQWTIGRFNQTYADSTALTQARKAHVQGSQPSVIWVTGPGARIWDHFSGHGILFPCVGAIEEAHMVWGTAGLLILFAALYFVIRSISRVLRGLGPRLVTCPEIMQPAIVEVAAGAKGIEGFPVLHRFRIRDCTHWPIRRDCGQDCLNRSKPVPAN
jgi:hypothetical protein